MLTTRYDESATFLFEGCEMGVSEKELSMLRLIDSEFQREVLDKLVRLETKMDSLMGTGGSGRVKIAEDKIAMLERNDLRNSIYNRVVSAAVSAGISVAIALHRLWWKIAASYELRASSLGIDWLL
jgi:hypothetical protein